MKIVLVNNSASPLYAQLVDQIKAAITSGELKPGDPLPSIRSLASDLRISVITTKRAYQELESEGLVETVPGKGTFVGAVNPDVLREERLRSIEASLASALDAAQEAGISLQELHAMLDLLAE